MQLCNQNLKNDCIIGLHEPGENTLHFASMFTGLLD